MLERRDDRVGIVDSGESRTNEGNQNEEDSEKVHVFLELSEIGILARPFIRRRILRNLSYAVLWGQEYQLATPKACGYAMQGLIGSADGYVHPRVRDRIERGRMWDE